MKTIILITLLVPAFLVSAQNFSSTYALQNVETGKNLRPYEAGSQNGNKMVLYEAIEWKCMTWKFSNKQGNIFQLKNLFTGKTFQPIGKPAPGTPLEQQALQENPIQYWEFIKQAEGNYLIRLQGTDLYMTPSSPKTNTAVLLEPRKTNTSLQLWKLVEQHPTM